MDTSPTSIRLWDYGWIHHDLVKLMQAVSDSALIAQYIASNAFHTSFVQQNVDETGIHGPFWADRITVSDYLQLQEGEISECLDSIQYSDLPGDDAAERLKIRAHLQRPFDENRKCYVLRYDERNRELFHEWGWVLDLFREFIFIGPNRDHLDRFIIGAD